MSDEQKQLQALFDIDDTDAEVVEGTGFEPGVKYQFSIEKAPAGKYMQYGAAKGGGFVLSKKCPPELAAEYQKHPAQFEIFTYGEINGQQALVPGKDFEKFKPYLTKIIDIAWVHNSDGGGKRLVFMTVNAGDKLAVNPGHPEWESPAVRLSRKLGYIPPEPKNKDGTPNKEKFTFAFLHPGVTITAEVVKEKRKNKDGSEKEIDKIDVDTIEIVGLDGKTAEPQKTLPADDIDEEMRKTIIDLAKGCKQQSDVTKKVKKFLIDAGETEKLGDYGTAITRMKERKEILQ